MTIEELIEQLRVSGKYDPDQALAADRIEELTKARDWLGKKLDREAEAHHLTKTKLAKAVDVLRLVVDACNEGKMVSLGIGGMTIDAQIRRSVYNQVPAWPIEEARAILDGLEK